MSVTQNSSEHRILLNPIRMRFPWTSKRCLIYCLLELRVLSLSKTQNTSLYGCPWHSFTGFKTSNKGLKAERSSQGWTYIEAHREGKRRTIHRAIVAYTFWAGEWWNYSAVCTILTSNFIFSTGALNKARLLLVANIKVRSRGRSL